MLLHALLYVYPVAQTLRTSSALMRLNVVIYSICALPQCTLVKLYHNLIVLYCLVAVVQDTFDGYVVTVYLMCALLKIQLLLLHIRATSASA